MKKYCDIADATIKQNSESVFLRIYDTLHAIWDIGLTRFDGCTHFVVGLFFV